MMSPASLAQAADRGSHWPWLVSAAEMAAGPYRALLPAAASLLAGGALFPRVAERTPADELSSVADARQFAQTTLRRWGVTSRCDDITVVLSELLTNALRYALPRPGGWPVRVGLLQPLPGSGVLCAVADPSPDLPVIPQPSGYLSESGRGLHVVEELSDEWGCTPPGPLGKVVWAAFAAGSEAPGESPANAAAMPQPGAPGRP